MITANDSVSRDERGGVPQRSEALPAYAPLLAARHAAHGPELERALRELWGGQNLDVLDVACGDGFYTASFAKLLGSRSRVTAIDLLPEFLDAARRLVAAGDDRRTVGFVQADAARLPFPDARFDLAWCAQSLVSLPDPAAAIREMRRVIRPGGLVGILENDRLHEIRLPWPVDLELAVRTAERQREHQTAHPEKRNRGRDLSDLVRQAGLTPALRKTLVVDRAAPLRQADAEFVRIYLKTLVKRVSGWLDPAQMDQLQRLSQPESPAYLAADESFWMSWSDMILIARRDS